MNMLIAIYTLLNPDCLGFMHHGNDVYMYCIQGDTVAELSISATERTINLNYKDL